MEKPTEQKGRRYVSLYKQLRSYILENNLRPGDVLPSEQTLCEMYGVSRNVLREALKGLCTMGILEGRPGVGNVILPFSVEELVQNLVFGAALSNPDIITQLLDVRKRLELAYLKEAYASLTSEDVDKLREIKNKMCENFEQNIYLHAEDRDFHLLLFSHVDNMALQAIFDCIWAMDANLQIEKKMQSFSLQTIIKHENIIAALEERNQDAFEAAMLLHFFSGKFANVRSNVQDISFGEY